MNVEQLMGTEKDYRQVKIAIGGDGQDYLSSFPHFEVSSSHEYPVSNGVTLVLPNTVAEYFRQQGRRELQAELRKLINAERG